MIAKIVPPIETYDPRYTNRVTIYLQDQPYILSRKSCHDSS